MFYQMSDEQLMSYMELLAEGLDAMLKSDYNQAVVSMEYKMARNEFDRALEEYWRRYPYDPFKTR